MEVLDEVADAVELADAEAVLVADSVALPEIKEVDDTKPDEETERVANVLAEKEPELEGVAVAVVVVLAVADVDVDIEADWDEIHNNLFHSRPGKQRAVTLREVHAGPTVVLGHHVLEEAPHVDGTNVEEESE